MPNRISSLSMLVVLAIAGMETGANASTLFIANLTGAQETTPTGSSATGVGAFTLNDAQTALTYSITVNGLDFTGSQTALTGDNLVAAHIHAPALLGANAGVVFGFFGAPFNDNNPNDVVTTPFTSGVGGTISGKWDLLEGNGTTTLAAQLPNLLAGLAYVNFHTSAFPAGEIRGQIPPAPIPGALPLFATGLGLLGWLGWRRKRRAALAA